MKNIIIGGVVRSGKSTLSARLVKEFNYSLFESDSVVHAFNEVFPELGITHKKPELTRENYKPFLHVLLNGNLKSLKYHNIVTVFPGSQFLPRHLADYDKINNHIVIFLGTNAPSAEELKNEIRKHDSDGDWTRKVDDEWLISHCEKVIKESIDLKEECEKYGFYYFDTTFNRESVFEEIVKLIKNSQE